MSKTVANDFMSAARAYDLDEAARDIAASKVQALGLSFDDPTTIHVVVGTALEVEGRKLVETINALPARVKSAATEAIGPVAKAATAKVRGDLANLGAQIGDRVGVSVTAAINAEMDSRHKTLQLRVGANLLVVIAMVALFASGLGYYLGKSNLTSISEQWQALATRADASDWLSLAATNPDLAATLRGSCGPGSPSAFIEGGSRACRVPLWIDSPAAPAVAGTVEGVYSSALDWLNRWSPAVLVGGGLVAGLLLRRGFKLVIKTRPLAWLLDL